MFKLWSEGNVDETEVIDHSQSPAELEEKIEAARGASASSLDQPMPMSGDGGTHTDIYR